MSEVTARQLQYFVAVIENGSVSAAAQAQHLSQSALSMAIGQLETAVRSPLFVRNRAKRIQPTPAALRLLPYARDVIETLVLVKDVVRDDHLVKRGILRVGCLPTLSPRILPGLVEAMGREHPQIELVTVEESPVELQDKLRAGQLDVAFVYRRLVEPEMARHDLAPAAIHIMLPMTHPQAGAASARLEDVVDLPLIVLDIPPTGDAILGIVLGLGFEPEPVLRSTNIETIREYVSRGLGYCLTNTVPDHSYSFCAGQVAYVPLENPIPQNAISAVTVGGRIPSARVEVAIDILSAQLNSSDGGGVKEQP